MKNVNYISAGAGSGKTYTLTQRLAQHIINNDVRPEEVILTTFTDKAAEEFRERAKTVLYEKGKYDEADRLDLAQIGTVHSIAYKMVAKYWYILGLSPQLKVMDENDVNFFISQSLADLPKDDEISFLNEFRYYFDIQRKKDYGYGFQPDYNYWKKYLTKIVEQSVIFNINDFKDSLEYSIRQVKELYTENNTIKMHEHFIDIMFAMAKRWKDRYVFYKREQHTVDFNDMEQYFLLLLEKSEVSDDIKSSYKYLFVDEFQDSSPVQVKIFDHLSELMAKSYFVGDFKQSIYGFRGTDAVLTEAVANIISLGQKGCVMEKPLDTCWRSQPEIVHTVNNVFVKAFNALTEEEKARVELKPCKPMLDNMHKGCLTYLDCGLDASNKIDNIANLARDIAYLVANGVKTNELAMLARSNKELDDLSDKLKNDYNLPVLRDGASIADSYEKTLLFAMLRLLVNRRDLLAKAELAYITEPGYSIDSIIDKKIEYDNNESDNKGYFLENIPLVQKLQTRYDELHSMSVASLVETLVLEFDLKSLSRKWDSTSTAYNNFDILISAAATYENHCQQMILPSTIDGFMQYLENVPPVQVGDTDGIRLVTYHGAKGLEWNHVVVMSLQDDPLEEKKMIKRAFYGVSTFHINKPNSGNLYPPMTISLLPWIYGRDQNIKDNAIKQKILNSRRYQQTIENEREENKRLLYVAVTRAKEHLYFAAFTSRRKNCPLRRFEVSGVKVNVDTINKRQVDCLQTGIPFNIIEQEIKQFASEHQMELTYPESHEHEMALNIEAEPCKNDKRDWVPSKMSAVAQKVQLVPNHWGRIKLGHTSNIEMSEIGSCIHQIFCSLEYNKNNSADFIKKVVSQWGVDAVLIDTDSILKAWQNLEGWLIDNYGMGSTFHELPFSYIDDKGHFITGSMDLVWKTTKGCVLVDYKTFPGKKELVLQPGDHYAGNYKGQFDSYTHALDFAGENVLARYVYYPVSGMLVKI